MHLVNQRASGDLRLVGPIFESFDFGFALPTGSELREPLNAAILKMREDGTLDRIMQTWLGQHD
jgi:polar amino acid transport system substrate-binding protein